MFFEADLRFITQMQVQNRFGSSDSLSLFCITALLGNNSRKRQDRQARERG